MAHPTDPHKPGPRKTVTLKPGMPPTRHIDDSDDALRARHLENTRRMTGTPARVPTRIGQYDVRWLDEMGREDYRVIKADADFGLEDICGALARGTMIETDAGPTAIEDIDPGTLVRTVDHGLQPVRWVSRCTPDFNARGASEDFLPVRVRADTMGELRPDTDLVVSSRFRFLLSGAACRAVFGHDEMLAPVRAYTDGDGIAPIYNVHALEFFNLMFDRHQLIRANGLVTESFHPGTYGMATMPPEVRREMMRLFPHLGGDMAAFGPVARPRLRAFEAAALRGVA